MSQPVPVLDTKVSWSRLLADPRAITYGRRSIALDEVEWVSYWAAHTATKRFLYPTTHHSDYHFEVGRYPYTGPTVAVHDYVPGRPDVAPESWTFLVNLAQRHLEPRLLDDLVARVRRGETVTVGGSVKVSQDGIACAKPRLSLAWRSISSTQPYNGMVWVYQSGVQQPVLTVPLSHPNAGLMPALFATLTS